MQIDSQIEIPKINAFVAVAVAKSIYTHSLSARARLTFLDNLFVRCASAYGIPDVVAQIIIIIIVAGEFCHSNIMPERRTLHSNQICTYFVSFRCFFFFFFFSGVVCAMAKSNQTLANVILNTNSKLSTLTFGIRVK